MQFKTATNILQYGECLCLQTFRQKYREQSHVETDVRHISGKFTVGQSDEIYGVTPVNWEDSSWKHLSLVSGAEIICLSHAKVYVQLVREVQELLSRWSVEPENFTGRIIFVSTFNYILW